MQAFAEPSTSEPSDPADPPIPVGRIVDRLAPNLSESDWKSSREEALLHEGARDRFAWQIRQPSRKTARQRLSRDIALALRERAAAYLMDAVPALPFAGMKFQDPEPPCVGARYMAIRAQELQQGVSLDPMIDRTNISALSARISRLPVLVLISCHRGAARGSV